MTVSLGKVAGALVFDVNDKLKVGAQVKNNMQNEKLSGVLGGTYKLCDKTNLKFKFNQNLKASLSVKHKCNSVLTSNFGIQLNQDCVPFAKGKATRLPFGLSFDINI